MTKKIATIVGARPQFVKAAAVTRALRVHDTLREVMIHTGQHSDHEMSDVFFQELDLPDPLYNLGVHGGGHGNMTGRMLAALEPILEKEGPNAVMVYGDTNSTLAGALVAAKLGIPIVHVEAGLRSFNRRMPEEINRVLVDHLSTLLMCPTHSAVKHLAAEGIVKGVHWVGDVMYDATLHARTAALESSRLLKQLGLLESQYALMTLHRAENTRDAGTLADLLDFVRRESNEMPVVFPVHPRTRPLLSSPPVEVSGIRLIDPLGYIDMHRLLSGAAMVFTDSGGLQKEAYFHRVPCITLRDETEWVETLSAGWNRLWKWPPADKRVEIHEYGHGDAALTIVRHLEAFLS